MLSILANSIRTATRTEPAVAPKGTRPAQR